MNDHYQKNSALRDENIELTNKLKGLIDQYELREQVCIDALIGKDKLSDLCTNIDDNDSHALFTSVNWWAVNIELLIVDLS